MKTQKSKGGNESQEAAKRKQVKFKPVRAHIAAGTRLFVLAGRPTKADFAKVYGPKGPKMTANNGLYHTTYDE
jgi:hypothetical protein